MGEAEGGNNFQHVVCGYQVATFEYAAVGSPARHATDNLRPAVNCIAAAGARAEAFVRGAYSSAASIVGLRTKAGIVMVVESMREVC